MRELPEVQGRCPSCGSESLFLGYGGYVTCSVIGCKAPDAATDLLEKAPQPDPDPGEVTVTLTRRKAEAFVRDWEWQDLLDDVRAALGEEERDG